MTDTDTLARQLARTATQAGLDKAAQILAEAVDDLDVEYDGTEYLDGMVDALNTLVQAGATDPR
jgi:hypothetical protein